MPTMNVLSLRDFLSEVGVAKWIVALGVTDSVKRRAGVKEALKFFQAKMPLLPVPMALNFLRAMDLSRDVIDHMLAPGEKVIAFRLRTESESKLFYTRSGASPHQSGINPAGRIAVQYVVNESTPVLTSYTTGAIDVWSFPAPPRQLSLAIRVDNVGVMVAGGGIQLIIPQAARHLEITSVAKEGFIRPRR